MSTDVITYHGEEFHLADKMGLMPLMRFAKLAQGDVDSETMEGLAAMYDLLEQCIKPDDYCASCGNAEQDKCCKDRRIVNDWRRFEQVAATHRDQGEELMEVVKQALEKMSARPTQRSSASSDGPPSTSGNSTAASSSPVVNRYEQQGRPDLALIVTEAIEAREARAS